jgi:hypothetical protein
MQVSFDPGGKWRIKLIDLGLSQTPNLLSGDMTQGFAGTPGYIALKLRLVTIIVGVLTFSVWGLSLGFVLEESRRNIVEVYWYASLRVHPCNFRRSNED